VAGDVLLGLLQRAGLADGRVEFVLELGDTRYRLFDVALYRLDPLADLVDLVL